MSTWLGFGLLFVTMAVAIALAVKANKSAVEFDEDEHELFVKGRH